MGEKACILYVGRGQKVAEFKGILTLVLAEDFQVPPALVAVLVNEYHYRLNDHIIPIITSISLLHDPSPINSCVGR